MLNNIKEWVNNTISGYTYRYGEWRDGENITGPICVVTHDGGGAKSVNVRRPRVKLTLLGEPNNRGRSQQLIADALKLVLESEITAPCGFTHVEVSEPVGPSFTTEGRAWVVVTLSLIY